MQIINYRTQTMFLPLSLIIDQFTVLSVNNTKSELLNTNLWLQIRSISRAVLILYTVQVLSIEYGGLFLSRRFTIYICHLQFSVRVFGEIRIIMLECNEPLFRIEHTSSHAVGCI